MTRAKTRPITLGYFPWTKSWHWLTASKSSRKRKLSVTWGANKKPLPLSALPSRSARLNNLLLFRALIKDSPPRGVLGPLLGILTVKNGPSPFSGSKQNFKDLIRTGQKGGALVFVFTPQNVNWAEETVEGYVYHPGQKRWVSLTFPLPNVVYNRIPDRLSEKKEEVRQCLERLEKDPRITLFNPGFFNKLELYHLLSRKEPLARHLPFTVPLESKKQLGRLLKEHKSLYLKPIHGKAGQGIVKAVYEPKRRYILLYHHGPKTRRIQAFSFPSFWKALRSLLQNKAYLAQQGIPLACHNGRPFDLRILVQKNKKGQWEVTGMGVRMAGPNRITTHVPQGGQIEEVDKVLGQLFPRQVEEIKEEVRSLALLVAQTLEQHYRHLGEFSLDMGVDQDGRLWLFEANAKPMKFDEEDIRQKSLINLIEYAQYLTFHAHLEGDEGDDLAQAN